MKYLLPILLLACSKATLTEPKQIRVKCVYYLHQWYGTDHVLDSTTLSIHFHRVTDKEPGKELQRFEAYPKFEPYCENNDTLLLKITDPCNEISK